jgi:small subunit ribosomal protein S20
MPITKTAKRALKKSLKRREKNLLQKVVLKKTEKKFLKLLASSNTEEAKKILNVLYKLLDKAAKTNLIKKNKAARDKSRLAKKLTKS